MKTPVNNISVYNFTPQVFTTEYPITVKDENGASQVIHQVIPDDEVINLACSDFSLSSLLKAGIDPAKMKVNTTYQSRQDAIQNALHGISDISLPESENTSENQN